MKLLLAGFFLSARAKYSSSIKVLRLIKFVNLGSNFVNH
jgi:hypothetical protein